MASALAVAEFRRGLPDADGGHATTEQRLDRAVSQSANRRIYEAARRPSVDHVGNGDDRSPPSTSMGSDLTIAHVGDSRAYLLPRCRAHPPHPRPLARRGAHATRQAHARAGGGDHPQRSIITRALGNRAARSRSTPGATRCARGGRGPALQRRSDVDDRRGPARPGAALEQPDLDAGRRAAHRRRPTTPAGATTSRSSCSGSRTSAAAPRARRPRRRPRSTCRPSAPGVRSTAGTTPATTATATATARPAARRRRDCTASPPRHRAHRPPCPPPPRRRPCRPRGGRGSPALRAIAGRPRRRRAVTASGSS